LESYKRALELDPNSFFPNYNMGVLLSLDRSKHADCIKHLKIALEQANRAGETLYELNVLINLALVLEIDGDYEEALTHLQRANELDPNNPKIL
jgi:tetratricopeptide (TPR) repeat protein